MITFFYINQKNHIVYLILLTHDFLSIKKMCLDNESYMRTIVWCILMIVFHGPHNHLRRDNFFKMGDRSKWRGFWGLDIGRECLRISGLGIRVRGALAVRALCFWLGNIHLQPHPHGWGRAYHCSLVLPPAWGWCRRCWGLCSFCSLFLTFLLR